MNKSQTTIDGIRVRRADEKVAAPKKVEKPVKKVTKTTRDEKKAREEFLKPVKTFDLDLTSQDVKDMQKQEKKPTLSKADQDMIDELDYEYKRTHKPYDRFERHWDEA